jgi:uncharacterized protein YndB with AHSA1/START domain
MADPKHVYEIYIRTTPEKLWHALTDPEFTAQYFHRVKSDFKEGSPISYSRSDGKTGIQGKVVVAQPPLRLVTTFSAVDEPFKNDRPSRVTWEIEKQADVCKLTLTHDDFDSETATFKGVQSGWPPKLSGLKTLLETGKALLPPR